MSCAGLWSKRRQTKTATRQYSNSYLSLLVIGLWRSMFFFKIMTEHTAPDPTEMNSFGVLVATSAEHFELSSKSDNSARRAVITPRTRLNSVKLYCSGGWVFTPFTVTR